MAYINQEQKKEIAPVIKSILKANGLKGSLSIRNHSTLTLTISEGSIDFIGQVNAARKDRAEREGFDYYPAEGNVDVNVYHYDRTFDAKTAKIIDAIEKALKGEGWFDKSDSMTDYFHVKHYIAINIGKWNKPYKLN